MVSSFLLLTSSFLTPPPPSLPQSHPQYFPLTSHPKKFGTHKIPVFVFLFHFRSGEVRVWNTGVEGDPLLASSGFTDLGHKEPVAKVHVV